MATRDALLQELGLWPRWVRKPSPDPAPPPREAPPQVVPRPSLAVPADGGEDSGARRDPAGVEPARARARGARRPLGGGAARGARVRARPVEPRRRVVRTRGALIAAALAGQGIAIGDPITPADGFQRLTEKLAVARGMDDRIGAFVIMEAFKKIAQEQRKPKGRKCQVAVYAVG